MIYNSILCIGDSLTYGSRDEYHRSYPIELAKMLNDRDPNQFWICINEGVPGERSGEILSRLPKLLNYPDAHLVIILVGTNDTRDYIPYEIYRDNMYQIIRTCQCMKSALGHRKVILGSLISVEGIGLLSYDKKSQESLVSYNIILNNLAIKLNVPLVDLTSLAKYRIDGCHFNNAGYKKMAELFFREIVS